MGSDVKNTSIQLSVPVWKILSQIKLDSGANSFDEVVKALIEIKGGYWDGISRRFRQNWCETMENVWS